MGVEAFEVFLDGDDVAGKNEVWADVVERLEDETAVGDLGVGDGEDVAVHDLLIEIEDIDVDDAWRIWFAHRFAAEVVFDALGAAE